jgi:selenocysteine lyase/cysteine desulfurase
VRNPLARRRYVECGKDGTFTAADVAAAIDDGPAPRLLAITGASNVTGWLPPLDHIIDSASPGRPRARRRRPTRPPPAVAS